MITERQQQILDLIVSLYEKSTHPLVLKLYWNRLKHQVRQSENDMKALENLGLIQRTYVQWTCSSISGYKYFVKMYCAWKNLYKMIFFQIMKSFDGEFYRLSGLI